MSFNYKALIYKILLGLYFRGISKSFIVSSLLTIDLYSPYYREISTSILIGRFKWIVTFILIEAASGGSLSKAPSTM